MLWFIALNDFLPTCQVQAQVAVLSSEEYSLDRHCLYSGKNESFCSWMADHNVTVIRRTSCFDDVLAAIPEFDYPKRSILSGTILRAEIPNVIKELDILESHYLFTDCDVIFQNDPTLVEGLPTKTFRVAPEYNINNWTHFNAGIQWCNRICMQATFDNYRAFVIKNKFKWPVPDQDSQNEFWKGVWEKLPLEFNWKPHWGINPNAAIVHFLGLKPHQYLAYKTNPDLLGDVSYQPIKHFLTFETTPAYDHYTSLFEYWASKI